ncbi:MAG: D-alanine--D-alanine ligase family protein [Dehalococcoidia bacterium]|nr:D-alanine--D-alanine ligase family protein [Dehalococcoidia bacterium]
MTARKTRLGVIFGGASGEHEVSVVSAQHVMAAADRERFEVAPIGVTKAGAWLTPSETQAQLDEPSEPYRKTLRLGESRGLLARPQALAVLRDIDVAFPLIHGPGGEDGTLQGLLELAEIPYVGAGVGASAVGLDKAFMKGLLRASGLPVVDYVVVTETRWEREPKAVAAEVESVLSYPVFVKPCNGGSSVGISKVRSREDLADSVLEALRYDRKLIIEQGVECREIECAVLGNDEPEASPLGEIRYQREFYDYEAKYLDGSTELIAPARLPPDLTARIQETAVAAYRAIDCSGMARVDCFLTPAGQLYIDELNTVPGFTPGSMYPRLWQEAGLSYAGLITRLVELGMERFRRRRELASL